MMHNSLRHKLRVLGITIARAVCAADDQSDTSITSLPQRSYLGNQPYWHSRARL